MEAIQSRRSPQAIRAMRILGVSYEEPRDDGGGEIQSHSGQGHIAFRRRLRDSTSRGRQSRVAPEGVELSMQLRSCSRNPRSRRGAAHPAQAPLERRVERAEIGKFRLTAYKPLDETDTLWLVAADQELSTVSEP